MYQAELHSIIQRCTSFLDEDLIRQLERSRRSLDEWKELFLAITACKKLATFDDDINDITVHQAKLDQQARATYQTRAKRKITKFETKSPIVVKQKIFSKQFEHEGSTTEADVKLALDTAFSLVYTKIKYVNDLLLEMRDDSQHQEDEHHHFCLSNDTKNNIP